RVLFRSLHLTFFSAVCYLFIVKLYHRTLFWDFRIDKSGENTHFFQDSKGLFRTVPDAQAQGLADRQKLPLPAASPREHPTRGVWTEVPTEGYLVATTE